MSDSLLSRRLILSIMEVRLGKPGLAIIFIGLAGFWFLWLGNLMDAFAFGDSTRLVQIGWVIVTVALVSFTVLMFSKLARLGSSTETQRPE